MAHGNPRSLGDLGPVLLWYALAGSVLAYPLVPHLVSLGPVGGVPALLAPLLAAASLGEMALQRWLLGRLADGRLFRALADPGSALFRSPQVGPLDGLGAVERGARALRAARSTTLLIVWALAESIAIYGLALTLVTADPRYGYGFAAVAFANLLLYYPRARDLEEQLGRWRRYAALRGLG